MLENKFGLHDLVGKKVNLDAELSSGVIEDTAILKKLTGKQAVRVEQKNQKAFDTFLHAKLWLSANEIPQTNDQTDAYYRRNIVISFPNKFEERDYPKTEDGKMSEQERADKEQGIFKLDPDLGDKLTTQEELSGIFNIMMFALRKLLKDKRIFTNEKTIKERRDKYEMAANPVSIFLRVAVDEESVESDWTSKDMVYRAYHRFCKHYKLSAISKEKFGKIIKTHYQEARIGPRNGVRVSAWKGMKFYDKIFSDKYLTNVDEGQDTLDDGGRDVWSDLV